MRTMICGLLLLVTLCLALQVQSAVPVHGEYNLADFGPVGTATDAQNTLVNVAIPQILAAGGGVLAVAPGAALDWKIEYTPSSSTTANTPTVTIIDRRLGYEKKWLPEKGQSGPAYNGSTAYAAQRFTRNVRALDMCYGAHPSQEILTNIAGNTASYLQNILNTAPVGPGIDCVVYANTIRGLAVGMKVRISGGTSEDPVIKALGWEAATQRAYIVVDLAYAHSTSATIGNKHWISGLTVTNNCQSNNQSATLSIRRNVYADGDSFGISTVLKNQANILTSQGDEGAVLYNADCYNDLNPFRSTVASMDWTTQELVYASGSVQNHTLGTGRPIINMNAAKWIRTSTVYAIATGYGDPWGQEGGVFAKGAIIGYGCGWTSAVVGRWIAIDEEEEYLDPANDPAAGYTSAPVRRIYRWWYITKLITRADGSQRLMVEHNIWNTNADCGPVLYNAANYTTSAADQKPLHYIIAPGAYVTDVSQAWTDSAINAGYVPASYPRKVKLAPSSDAYSPTHDFAVGDTIEQAIGQLPFNPTGFRVRHHNYVTPWSTLGDTSFESKNNGRVSVSNGFSLGGGTGNISEIEDQKDKLPLYTKGLNIAATTKYGIYFGADQPGDFQTAPWAGGAAIYFAQPNSRTQYITWKTTGAWASLWVDPLTGHLNFKDISGRRPLHTSGVCLDNAYVGISATTTPANNLRGINKTVTTGATTVTVTFAVAEPDAVYAVSVTPSWLTTFSVTGKATTGFTINFGTAAPAGAKYDWLIIR